METEHKPSDWAVLHLEVALQVLHGTHTQKELAEALGTSTGTLAKRTARACYAAAPHIYAEVAPVYGKASTRALRAKAKQFIPYLEAALQNPDFSVYRAHWPKDVPKQPNPQPGKPVCD